MPEPILKFPVTCPTCALESVSELSIAVIANALLTGHYWTATFTEREQLRKSLRALKLAAHPLNVTEPPVCSPRLHGHHPTA